MKGLVFVAKDHNRVDDYATLLEEERLILEATELVHRLMEGQDVNRAELARRIGASKGHVTQLLDGKRNMTLRTLARWTKALNSRAKLEAEPLTRRASAPQPILAQTLDVYVKCARAVSPARALGHIEIFSASHPRVVAMPSTTTDLDSEFADLLSGAA